MNDLRWRTNHELLLLAIADRLAQSHLGDNSFVIATASPEEVIPALAAHETLDAEEDHEGFARFVTEDLWDTIDDEARIVASFDWMRDYATMSLTRLSDGRCIVWWNDEYVRHLPIGLMRSEDAFPDFFEAYNSEWHGLAEEGGQWGGVPTIITDTVPLAVVLRTIFRFLLYSGQGDWHTGQHPPSGDASEYYDRLVAAGGAGIRDDELAMPPWVRPQERALWEAVYADCEGIT